MGQCPMGKLQNPSSKLQRNFKSEGWAIDECVESSPLGAPIFNRLCVKIYLWGGLECKADCK